MSKPFLLCVTLAIAPALAGDLVVTVTGVASEKGEIGCALFADAAGFPMDASKATSMWVKPKLGAVACRFPNLAAGVYALAVSHDLNSNRKTDTNFMGIPKEDWGVSNNVRPKLRAPRFDEARFEVNAEGTTRMEVKIGR